jgi:ferrous iron transport protein A
MTLDQLKNGHRATVTGIAGHDPLAQRLMALGLLEGTEVRVTRRALGGDPIEITVWGSTLSLRRDEARRIMVAAADG